MRPLGWVAGLAGIWLALAASPPPAAGQPQVESCVACHQEIGDERLAKPAQEYGQADVHAAKGFGCTACHGGDPNEPGLEAMDPAKGYIGKPAGAQLVQVCGRCHSDPVFMKRYNPALRVDQVAEYQTSVHGRRLRELRDPKVATCASCHAAHVIRPPSDPRSSVHPLRVAETCGRCHADAAYMKPYGIPTDQLASYRASIHWAVMSEKGDLSAPTCNDCHGNHGAAPPGVSWVGNVCAQCHAVLGEYFAKSRHSRVFAQLGTPGCATCHSNHEIKPADVRMLGLAEGAVCANCHGGDDAGGQTAQQLRALLDALRGRYDEAHALLARAERAGMEVSQAQFDLNVARDALTKARAAVHAFAVGPVQKEADEGVAVAEKAYARAVRALDELQFRRKGLAASLVVILALIGGLVLKIRQIDRGRARSGSPTEERDHD